MKTILYDEQGNKLHVEFNYYKGSPQTWDYPGDPPELEVLRVEDDDGNKLKLTEELDEKLSNEIFENLDQHLPEPDEPDYSEY